MAVVHDLNHFLRNFLVSYAPAAGLPPDDDRSDDPGVGVFEPLRRHPAGRAGGVALLEPDDELVTADAVGRSF